jgi:hypothetical protein
MNPLRRWLERRERRRAEENLARARREQAEIDRIHAFYSKDARGHAVAADGEGPAGRAGAVTYCSPSTGGAPRLNETEEVACAPSAEDSVAVAAHSPAGRRRTSDTNCARFWAERSSSNDW